jgi:hypothetical protein
MIEKMNTTHLRHTFTPILFFLASLFLIISCSKTPMQNSTAIFPNINQVPETQLVKLEQKQILFGHASVGDNIAAGLQDLVKDYPKIKLNVIENDNLSSKVKDVGFIHFHLLKEGLPPSKITFAKIDTFASLIKDKLPQKPDIAFFKLCWADITPYTDTSKVFSYYRDTMAKLRREFPQTTFVQFTVPLAHEAGGVNRFTQDIKGGIRGLLKVPQPDIFDNKTINELNTLIRKEYQGQPTFFDIAQIESTFPDGKRQEFSSNGKKYFSIVPDYTSDMGHLNEKGRKVVAEQLLILLSKLV